MIPLAESCRFSSSAIRPDVSVIVVAWRQQDLLDRCLARIPYAMGALSYEVVVVDNGSDPPLVPPSPTAAAEWIRSPTNAGFARAANLAAVHSRGRQLLFLNTDVELSAGSVDDLCSALCSDVRLAAVAPVARGARGEVRFPGFRFLGPFNQAAELVFGRPAALPGRTMARPRDRRKLVDCDWLRASVLLVRTDLFRALGGFDEGYFFYEEDEDLCWRLRRKGHRVAVAADVVVSDPGAGSTAAAGRWPVVEFFRAQRRFVRKRFGPVGETVYRCVTTYALVGKALARGHAPRVGLPSFGLADALRGLWTRPLRPRSTKGA